ncbi:MAG TPA: hypothetical protein DIC60_04770 [Lachnospiraceae bacterium]|nr:hypothetical protein [Lachnospiraceae bacterium]
MAENVAERSNIYNVLAWACFVLSFIATPVFAILGIILGIFANKQETGKGTTAIWANSILLIVGTIAVVLLYGIAGLSFFWVARSIMGI